jgi:hypothetical protein
MQARFDSMAQQERQQMTEIQRLNAVHAADVQRLQRFQAALNAAAAAGDPTAIALRSPTPEATLDRLTTQLNALGRKRRGSAPVTSTEVLPPDLSGARLPGAVLAGARLVKATLTGADLTKADLSNSRLEGANLRGAKLQGTNLSSADLTQADLTDALYDAATRWPTGFDPQKHGALLVR